MRLAGVQTLIYEMKKYVWRAKTVNSFYVALCLSIVRHAVSLHFRRKYATNHGVFCPVGRLRVFSRIK